MPQPGELRRGATEDVRWDGSRWQVLPKEQAPAGPEMHHPGLSESPTDAFTGELERTAGKAALGFAKSPWSALKALVGLPATAVRGLTEIPQGVEALMDPATYNGAIPAAKQAITDLGNDPEGAGNLLGQLILGETVGPKLPGMAKTAVEEGPGVLGRGISKTGRGLESASRSRIAKVAEYGGLGDLIYRGDPKGALVAGAPTAARLLGKGMQKVGGSLEGLKLAADAPVAEPPPSVVSGLTLSKDALGRNIEATNMVEDGFSPAQAGKLSGIPGAGKSKLVSNINHLPQLPEMDVQEVLDGLPLPQKDWAIGPEENEQVSLNRLRAAGKPDAMSAFEDWDKTGPTSGTRSFEMDGVKYAPNAEGSHVAVPDEPATQYDGQGFQIEDNPDYFDTDRPGTLDLLKQAAGQSSYDARTALDPDLIDAEYARNRSVVDQMRAGGLFGGNRSVQLKP